MRGVADPMTHTLAADLDHVLATTEGIWESLRGHRIFITGGTGFVGTWLTESLLWANTRLNLGIEAVLLTRSPEAFHAKVPHIASHKTITLLRGSAQNFEYPDGEFRFVIHAATEGAAKSTPENPAGSFDADLTGTRRVLEFAHEAGTQRLLFTSSGAVYGRQPRDIAGIPEDYCGAPSTMDENSAYGQAKRASEYLCSMYACQFGFNSIIARLFAFVGPYLPLEGYAVGNFLRDAINGRTIRIESDGTTVRSYLYAADMAAWLWTVLLKGKSRRPYNVGSPHAITVAELAEAILTISGRRSSVAILGERDVPATRYVPDTSRVTNELGLRPRIALQDALQRTFQWHEVQAESRSIGQR